MKPIRELIVPNPSIHKPAAIPGENWKWQWARVKRWYERIKLIEDSYIGEVPREEPITQIQLDDIYAFFQNCYHLKYWIETCHPELAKQLNDVFERTIEFQVCRDICNSLKHLQIGSSKIDNDFYFAQTHDPFASSSGNPVKYFFVFQDTKKDKVYNFELFRLIKNLVKYWKCFIYNHISFSAIN